MHLDKTSTLQQNLSTQQAADPILKRLSFVVSGQLPQKPKPYLQREIVKELLLLENCYH